MEKTVFILRIFHVKIAYKYFYTIPDWLAAVIESIKTTSMEHVSTRVLEKNEECLRR